MHQSKLIAYNKNGDHFYRKTDGTTVLISRELMKECEDLHIRPEHNMPGYDPIWEYNWHRLGEELEQRKWFELLTDEQRDELKRRVK